MILSTFLICTAFSYYIVMTEFSSGMFELAELALRAEA
jgi:hypothetical protein